MGNTLSFRQIDESKDAERNPKGLVNLIDDIATRFILNQNFLDMLRFTDKQYYDNLIILTASILKDEMSEIELSVLHQRAKGQFKAKNLEEFNGNSREIYLTSEEDLQKLKFRNEKQKEKALYTISKFYVKIMTIFSAITSVVDPQYVYTDEEGKNHYFYLKDFNDYKMVDKEMKELRVHQLYNPMNLVRKRLNILRNKMQNSNANNENSEFTVINPGEKFCTMNMKSNGETNGSATLQQEIGIRELDSLYYDVYDMDEKSWNKRSPKMQKKYEKDLNRFYQIFTGKKKRPTTVTSFSDIESLPYHNLYRCKNQEYFKDLVVQKNDALFVKYMEKIESIEENTKAYKQKLFHVLSEIFVYKQDTGNGEQTLVINPNIDINDVLALQEQTKDCIINLYSSCESSFIEALLIYEKMYEKQYGVLNNAQMNNIEALDATNAENESKNKPELSVVEGVAAPVVNNAQQSQPYIQNSLSSMKIEPNSISNIKPENNMEKSSNIPVSVSQPDSISNGVQNSTPSENVLQPQNQPPLLSVGPNQSYPIYQQPVSYVQPIPSAAPAQSQLVPSVAPPQGAEISQLPTFLRSEPQNSALSSPPSDVIQTPISNPQLSVQPQTSQPPQISMPASIVPQQPVQQVPSQPAVPGLIPFAQPQPQYPVFNSYAAPEAQPPTTTSSEQQPETVTQNNSSPNTDAQENTKSNAEKTSENEPKPSMFSSFFSTESPKVINNQESTNKNNSQGSNSVAAAPPSQENIKDETAPSIFGSFFSSTKKENTQNQPTQSNQENAKQNSNLESSNIQPLQSNVNEDNDPGVGSNSNPNQSLNEPPKIKMTSNQTNQPKPVINLNNSASNALPASALNNGANQVNKEEPEQKQLNNGVNQDEEEEPEQKQLNNKGKPKNAENPFSTLGGAGDDWLRKSIYKALG